MASKQKLEEQGWYISPQGFETVTENGSINDYNKALRSVLDSDLKEFGSPILATEIKKSRTSKVVLQIQKVRNISAPKANENSQAAPRMLKLILTDGHTYCQGVEVASLPFLSRNQTAPGSKIQINGALVLSGCILLEPSCCALLGGKVPALYEKWELAKSISEHRRSSAGTDGPPPWVNFGEKVVSSVTGEHFKSLIGRTTTETSKEFDLQRQGAIAEATTGAVKKFFGGGIKNSFPSHEERPNFNNYKDLNRERPNREPRKDFRGKRDTRDKPEEKTQKPPEKVSLFDFLEDKLPQEQNPVPTLAVVPPKPEYDSYKPYNNRDYRNSYDSRTKFRTNQRPTNDYKSNKTHESQNFPKFAPQKQYPRTNKPQNDNHSVSSAPSYSSPKPNTTNSAPSNTTVNALTKNMGKMSFDSQFATRSLRQHLNLGAGKIENRKPEIVLGHGTWSWKVGDQCMAKYWEDNKYYNATVTNLTARTCVVRFNEYGNTEEVLQSDCIPITDVSQESHLTGGRPYKGSVEFRRNGKRPDAANRNFNKDST